MFEDFTGKALVLTIQHHSPPYSEEQTVLFVQNKKDAIKVYQEFAKDFDVKFGLYYNNIVDGIAESQPQRWKGVVQKERI